jgi:hypothetical protein
MTGRERAAGNLLGEPGLGPAAGPVADVAVTATRTPQIPAAG